MDPPPAESQPFQESAAQISASLGLITVANADRPQISGSTDSATLLAMALQSIMNFAGSLTPVLHAAVADGEVDLPGAPAAPRAHQQEHLQEALHTLFIHLRNIRAEAFNSTKKYKSHHINLSISPITPPYPQTEECIVTQVTDSALKSVALFKGENPDCPADLQFFLRSVYDLGQTHHLTHATIIRILQRKTDSVARTLLDSFLVDLDLQADDALLKVALFLESKFALSWSPSLARAQLVSLQKSHAGTTNYTTLHATILRLSHLASLDQPELSRPEFVTSHQLSSFLACLSKADQNLLLRSEAQRTAQNLPKLTLATAVDELLNHHATRTAHASAKQLLDRSGSMAGNPPTEGAFYAPQPREPPARARQTSRAPNRPRRSSEPPPTRRDNARAPSRRPTPRDEGRPSASQRQDSRQSRSAKGAQAGLKPRDPKPKDGKPIFHTPESAGVPRGNCLRCNSSSHLMNSPRCHHAGQEMPPTPCRQPGCAGGLHWSKHCKAATSTRDRQSRPRESQGRRSARPSRPRSSAAQRLHQPATPAFAAQEYTPEDAIDQYFSH